MLTRSHRRRTALALGSLTLVLASFTGCGLSSATNRAYTPAAGAVRVESQVKVVGAVVVSAQEGSGTFIANLANSDQSAPVSFESLTDVSGEATAADFTAMEIGPGGMLNLAEDGGVELTGDFGPGDALDLTLAFSTGDQVDITVFVVDDDGFYAGFDGSGDAETDTEPETETGD